MTETQPRVPQTRVEVLLEAAEQGLVDVPPDGRWAIGFRDAVDRQRGDGRLAVEEVRRLGAEQLRAAVVANLPEVHARLQRANEGHARLLAKIDQYERGVGQFAEPDPKLDFPITGDFGGWVASRGRSGRTADLRQSKRWRCELSGWWSIARDDDVPGAAVSPQEAVIVRTEGAALVDRLDAVRARLGLLDLTSPDTAVRLETGAANDRLAAAEHHRHVLAAVHEATKLFVPVMADMVVLGARERLARQAYYRGRVGVTGPVPNRIEKEAERALPDVEFALAGVLRAARGAHRSVADPQASARLAPEQRVLAGLEARLWLFQLETVARKLCGLEAGLAVGRVEAIGTWLGTAVLEARRLRQWGAAILGADQSRRLNLLAADRAAEGQTMIASTLAKVERGEGWAERPTTTVLRKARVLAAAHTQLTSLGMMLRLDRRGSAA